MWLFPPPRSKYSERHYRRLWVWTKMNADGQVLRLSMRTFLSVGTDRDIHVGLPKAPPHQSVGRQPEAWDSCGKSRCGDPGSWQPPQAHAGEAAQKGGQRLVWGVWGRDSTAHGSEIPCPPSSLGPPVDGGHVLGTAGMLLGAPSSVPASWPPRSLTVREANQGKKQGWAGNVGELDLASGWQRQSMCWKSTHLVGELTCWPTSGDEPARRGCPATLLQCPHPIPVSPDEGSPCRAGQGP